MMLSKLIFSLVLLFTCVNSFAITTNILTVEPLTDSTTGIEKQLKIKVNFLPKINLFSKGKVDEKNKSKLVAGLLALTLGPFGVHRLYLGTSPRVPIAYTLTLGGGFFILPLIDIFYIILSENPEDIEDNNHVFIWNKKKTQK